MSKVKPKVWTEWRLRNLDGRLWHDTYCSRDTARIFRRCMHKPDDWTVIRVEIRPVEKKKGKVK